MAKNASKTLNLNLNLTSTSSFEVHATLTDLDKEFKKLIKESNTFAGVCSKMWALRPTGNSKGFDFIGKFETLLGMELKSLNKKQYMATMKTALENCHEAMKGEMEEDGKFENVYVLWGKKAVTLDLDESVRTKIEEIDGHFIEINKTVYILDKDKKKTYEPNAKTVDSWSIEKMWKFFVQSKSLELRGIVAAAIVESGEIAA